MYLATVSLFVLDSALMLNMGSIYSLAERMDGCKPIARIRRRGTITLESSRLLRLLEKTQLPGAEAPPRHVRLGGSAAMRLGVASIKRGEIRGSSASVPRCLAAPLRGTPGGNLEAITPPGLAVRRQSRSG